MSAIKQLPVGFIDRQRGVGQALRVMVAAIRRRFPAPSNPAWLGVSGLMLLLALPIAGPAAETAPVPAEVVSVAAEHTQFRLTLTDGRILRSPELAGAKLIVATPTGPVKILISAVERDPGAKAGDVWLHTLLVEQPDDSTPNMCDPGPDGRRQGFPLATTMGPDASVHITEPEQFEIVCTAGVRGKCVRWGYRPWEPDERDLHEACTRMARADYCGGGVATTRNGTTIDMFDDRRIQTTDNDPSLVFEAGWTTKGAVCVRHVRIKENISLDGLVAACPRLVGKVGDMCTESVARSLGATLFNLSRP